MSTRSYICMEVGDNQYKTIYCHSDGYLSNNGALLLKYYSDRKTVERLVGCFREEQSIDGLLANVKEAFGIEISVEAFEEAVKQ